MSFLLLNAAKLIPDGIRKHLIAEGLIDKAVNLQDNKPMEYLFDVYEEFVDRAGEHEDWSCFKCREAVLQKMRQLKPFIIQLNNEQQENI